MTTMAPPKKKTGKGGRPASDNPKRRVVSFRCSEDFGQWLDDLTEKVRIPPAVLIELAIIKWAKEEARYGVEPPKR